MRKQLKLFCAECRKWSSPWQGEVLSFVSLFPSVFHCGHCHSEWKIVVEWDPNNKDLDCNKCHETTDADGVVSIVYEQEPRRYHCEHCGNKSKAWLERWEVK